MDIAHDPQATERLRAELDAYARRWPAEGAVVGHFVELLAELDSAPFMRTRLAGHFTGSAWLVDRSGTRVLLTHHRKLGRWLQLGGHADGDSDLGRVALKEAGEESGLDGLTLEPGLFDLDRHWIPARGDVPAHWHYDVRYVVRAGANENFVVGEESLDLAWRDVRELIADPASDESVRRMSEKWLLRARDGAG
ncbi:MAG TPA: NUDIX hydrolase [Lysobacter sp.]|nr:NUDIX hydrolase [Lysobacter sp.]